jgi:hypothetical protein
MNYCCDVCGSEMVWWRIDRRGDVVASWTCRDHLADGCVNLQRDGEDTELVVRLARLEVAT